MALRRFAAYSGMKKLALVIALAIAAPAAHATAQTVLPTWSEQIAIREGWLVKRHAMLLPMMRRHGIGMWIIVNEEFHDDPLAQLVAPPRPYTGNHDVFVFIDAGDRLRAVAVTGYGEAAASSARSRKRATIFS